MPTAHERSRVPFRLVLLDVALAGGPALLFATLAAPTCFCVVGIPLYAYALGAAYLATMGVRERWARTLAIGALGAPIHLMPIGACVLSIGAPSDPASLRGLLTLAATFAGIGVVVSPFHGAPLAAIERGRGMLDALLTSGATSIRQGLAKTAARGATLGVIAAIPTAIVPMSGVLGAARGLFIAVVAAAIVVTSILGLAIVAYAWGEGRQRFGGARGVYPRGPIAVDSVRSALLRSLALPLVSVVAVLGLVVVALATPSPAWRLAPHIPSHAIRLSAAPSPLAPSGLAVRAAPDAITISTADGGGAGEVRVPDRDPAGDPMILRDTEHGQERWALYLPRGRGRDGDYRAWIVSFDDDGVRTDDAPPDRLAARFGSPLALMLLALHLACLAALVLFTLRRLTDAALLDRPSFRAERELTALSGTFRGEGRIAKGTLTLDEPASLEVSGLGAAALAPGAHRLLLRSSAERLRDGELVTAIATLTRADEAPFRAGRLQLGEGTRLILGELEAARAAYAEQLARVSVAFSLVLLPIVVALANVVVRAL